MSSLHRPLLSNGHCLRSISAAGSLRGNAHGTGQSLLAARSYCPGSKSQTFPLPARNPQASNELSLNLCKGIATVPVIFFMGLLRIRILPTLGKRVLCIITGCKCTLTTVSFSLLFCFSIFMSFVLSGTALSFLSVVLLLPGCPVSNRFSGVRGH